MSFLGEYTMEYSRYSPASLETQAKLVKEYKEKQEEAVAAKGKKKKN